MTLSMDMDKLLAMCILDFLDTIEEVAEVVSDRKRIQTRDPNRGHRR